MAAVLVQIRGTLYDLTRRTSQQVLLQGEASLVGLGVGGGPIEGGGGGGEGIWGGGNVPMPTPPIANVPGAPGYRPPGDGIWGGGNVPMPSPPIANVPGLPPHPDQPPDVPPEQPPGTVVKPPPTDGSGGWGYVHPYGWAYFPGGSDAGPKG